MADNYEFKNRAISWKGLDCNSLEYFKLQENNSGWSLSGTVVSNITGQFLSVTYRIETDKEFNTARAFVEMSEDGSNKEMEVQHVGSSWFINGKINPDMEGCTDIDLEVTPSTNTLPIRRMNPRVGQTISVSAAWLRFPTFRMMRLGQSYERTSRNHYIYRSRNFEAGIDVDSYSVVTRYEGIWEEVK